MQGPLALEMQRSESFVDDGVTGLLCTRVQESRDWKKEERVRTVQYIPFSGILRLGRSSASDPIDDVDFASESLNRSESSTVPTWMRCMVQTNSRVHSILVLHIPASDHKLAAAPGIYSYTHTHTWPIFMHPEHQANPILGSPSLSPRQNQSAIRQLQRIVSLPYVPVEYCSLSDPRGDLHRIVRWLAPVQYEHWT